MNTVNRFLSHRKRLTIGLQRAYIINRNYTIQAKTKVLYDGECPLCEKEINFLKWVDKDKQNVNFVDISQQYMAEDHSGIPLKDAMGVMHVIGKDGKVYTKVEAMHVMYNAVGLGWLWKWTNITGVKTLIDNMYMWFAKNRLKLTGREWCESGQCAVKIKQEEGLNVKIKKIHQSYLSYGNMSLCNFQLLLKQVDIAILSQNLKPCYLVFHECSHVKYLLYTHQNVHSLSTLPKTWYLLAYCLSYIFEAKIVENLIECKKKGAKYFKTCLETEKKSCSSSDNINVTSKRMFYPDMREMSILLKDNSQEVIKADRALQLQKHLSMQRQDGHMSEGSSISNHSEPVFQFSDFPFRDQPIHYKYVLSKDCQYYFDKIQITRDIAEFIEKETCDIDSPLGHYIRKYILTSRRFLEISTRCSNAKKLARILYEGYDPWTAKKKYGNITEPLAAKVYEEYTGNTVYNCGLVIDPKLPHLGTTPDRKVYDPHIGSFGLLEIKCPYVNMLPHTWFLNRTETGFSVKDNSVYYYQVLGQLGITGFEWCDFMVLDRRGDIHIERIYFDDDLWAKLKQKLDMFYFEVYLPFIVQYRNSQI